MSGLFKEVRVLKVGRMGLLEGAKRASGLRGSPAEEGAGPPSSRSFVTEAPSEPASTSASGPHRLTG